MQKSGPIIIIEDDLDDQVILKDVFETIDCGNELVFFKDGLDAFAYMSSGELKPFLILSDINLPKKSGFELRHKIFANEKLRLMCIPYLFFTTASDKKSVEYAYELSVQGFFQKPDTYFQLQKTMQTIVDYWQQSMSPSQFQ